MVEAVANPNSGTTRAGGNDKNSSCNSNDGDVNWEFYHENNIKSVAHEGYEYEMYDFISGETGQAAGVTLARMHKIED